MSEDQSPSEGEGSGRKRKRVDSGASIPEGMRVVRKRRKKKGSGSRQTLFLKKREIMRDMHEDTGAVGVKEQVERLKSAKKAKEEQKPVEERWGGTREKHRGAKWTILMVFALLIPILAIITGFAILKGGKREKLAPVSSRLNTEVRVPEKPMYDPTSAVGWFHDNSALAVRRAVEILEEIDDAGNPILRGDLLRDSELATAKIRKDGPGWNSGFFVADPRRISWEFGASGQTGYMVLNGRRMDFTPFRSYFVKTKNGLKLDWEATSGWSEVAVRELIAEAPVEPVLVRCWLGKEARYDTTESPGHLVSWYLLLSPNEVDHVWARVPAGSDLDLKIRSKLQYGLFLLQRKPQIRATIRLKKPVDAKSEGEFEIEEFLTEEWVLP